MPEREARSLHLNNGKSVQPIINPNQSAWLTHWAGSRFESTTHDHLTQLGRTEGDDQDFKKHLTGIEIASDNFGSSKDVDLAMSLKKPGSQSFPFFKCGQESGRSSISNEGGETKGMQALGPQVSHKKLTTVVNAETSSRECHFQLESISQIPIEQVKYHMFFGDSSYSNSRPPKEKFANSHTTHKPENFRQLTAFAAKDPLPLPETNFLDPNLNSFPKHEKSEMPPFLRQNNKAAVIKNDPSTNRSPAFLEEQYKRMQKHIGMGFFPHQTGTQETTKSGRPCSFQDVPHFVHDVEMARMCAPLSSVEGLAGGLHSFSRTTHSLLITKQTDGKLYQENQIFRESRVSTQLKGDALRELNCIPPLVTHGQRGVKLQLLDSSDHESQENVEGVKATGDVQKNESSADTDAMDMESFKENRVSGVHLSLPNKNIMVESNLPLQPPINLTEKDTRKKRLIELPDINLDLSTLPATSNSTEKPEPCSSRTQSLDMNTLQFNVDHSDECSDNNLGSEPGSRWIKRLKLSASSSLALGTKTSKLAESSSNGKLNHLFTRAVEHKDSESLDGKFQLKESVFQIGECSTKQHPSLGSLFGKGDSSSLETKLENKDKDKEITLSHSWIQRWSHTQNQKNQKSVEICKKKSEEEENSNKRAPEEFEKKQFPSIAAMALMGKAMTGFQQCKFQKKESCVIWNTKSFEQ